ncbi:MAG: glutamate formiminotransferase [Acidimicrobiales bacterium]|nr:glutamate formiminotransferase [Acidimicrobiales bacterium]
MPDHGLLAECVINISDGRSRSTIEALRGAAGTALLDVHSDAEHNRTVLTLGGPLAIVEDAARLVVATAVARIDLRSHAGIHPRLGAADVVPFVPLVESGTTEEDWARVIEARDSCARWAGSDLELPCFLYGPERSLPEVRRSAFRPLTPDTGPRRPHPTAGATAVGARPILVAYNVWIADGSSPDDPDAHPSAPAVARSLAGRLRSPAVRTLGLEVEAGAQVSFNLIDLGAVSVVDVYDAVAAGAESHGCSVLRAELVGLIPEVALRAVPRNRWAQLNLGEDRTIESRLAARGYPIG